MDPLTENCDIPAANSTGKVCRICLNIISSDCSYNSLQTSAAQAFTVLKFLIPHFDTEIVSEAVLCSSCNTELNNIRTFREKCIESEKKICSYVQRLTVRRKLSHTDLLNAATTNLSFEDVYVKQEKDDEQLLQENLNVEMDPLCDHMYVKQEELEVKSDNEASTDSGDDDMESRRRDEGASSTGFNICEKVDRKREKPIRGNITHTPADCSELTDGTLENLLPEKSKGAYKKVYDKFKMWCDEMKVTDIGEEIMLAYFDVLNKSYKSSTLWRTYSILRSIINIKQNVDISKYAKLQEFLKQTSVGYEPKKSNILEFSHIQTFLSEAPDAKHLLAKVVLVIAYSGACRREEIMNLSTDDIQYKPDSIFITIRKYKNNQPRVFAITDPTWIDLINRYANLRPKYVDHKRFFLSYRFGCCTAQPVGVNKVGEMPKIIARYLKLNNPEKYSGHCFRRSSAAHLADNGGDLVILKHHGGSRGSTVGEGYVDNSVNKGLEAAKLLSVAGGSVS